MRTFLRYKQATSEQKVPFGKTNLRWRRFLHLITLLSKSNKWDVKGKRHLQLHFIIKKVQRQTVFFYHKRTSWSQIAHWPLAKGICLSKKNVSQRMKMKITLHNLSQITALSQTEIWSLPDRCLTHPDAYLPSVTGNNEQLMKNILHISQTQLTHTEQL